MKATKTGVDHEMTTRVNPAASVSQSTVTQNGMHVGWLHTSGGVDEEHIESSARDKC
jgi:hypothetical protein